MSSETLDEDARSQLYPTATSLLILAGMSLLLVVASPWGFDPVFSPVSHFLKWWPLVLLALLVYVTKAKLDEPDRTVP